MGGECGLLVVFLPPVFSTACSKLTIFFFSEYIEVIREKVQDGITGETKDLQYTQCKIVGNGSFGVVFQTKLSPSGEDAAIKRVLQDKRFKVRALAHFYNDDLWAQLT